MPHSDSIPDEFNPRIYQNNYLIRRSLLKSIQPLASKLTGRLLDFGCGSKPYKSLFHNKEYIGLDFDGEGHSHANEDIDVFYDGKKIPFSDDYFDSVFSSEVFEHIFNLPDIMKELNRVMKKNGLILITCPFSICEHEIPIDYARYTSFGIKNILEKNGYEIIMQEKTGDYILAIFQFINLYWEQCIMKYFNKIPVIRTVIRLTFFSFTNITSLLLSKILPNSKDLYLNNVILAKKINNL